MDTRPHTILHPWTTIAIQWHHQPGPPIHISIGQKAILIGLIAKPIRLMSPMLPKVAHGGLKFFWWYDKISYAPAPSAVRPLCRQAKSDFRWPIRPLPCQWLGRWVFCSGMGSGVTSMYVEVLWRILGNFFSTFSFPFFLFIMEPFSFLCVILMFASWIFFNFFF